MINTEKVIYVYIDQNGTLPALIGKLYTSFNRGKEAFSFEYDNEWFENNHTDAIFDPAFDLHN